MSPTTWQAGAAVLQILGVIWLGAGIYAWGRHRDLFREVSLRHPILAFESDDWGPGPAEDGARLRELAACAGSYRDDRKRPAVITIGVVLAIADTAPDASTGDRYRRITLDSERFSRVRDAMLEGAQQGVFFLQLHGAEHYWPPALMAAARRDEAVARWLSTDGVPRTESLPSHLQSRWIDASSLPSTPLSDSAISLAAEDDVRLFETVFGESPTVVVPPTFVWDERVERAWTDRGIRVVITPGCRQEARDVRGNLQPLTKIIRNGDRSVGGDAIYLVRDVYFEPSLGHRAEDTLTKIRHRARLGRPALVEMHRFNFVNDIEKARSSLSELDRLFAMALASVPNLRFVSPRELAGAILQRDPDLIETRLMGRVQIWLRRLWDERQMRWLFIATAAALPVALLWLIATAFSGELREGSNR